MGRISEYLSKCLSFLANHNSVIQLLLLLAITIIQVLFSAFNVNQFGFVIACFIFIGLELLQIASLLEYQNDKRDNECGCLCKRPKNSLEDLLFNTKKELYITGINCNNVINKIYGDTYFLDFCLKNKITLKFLVFDVKDIDKLNWQCELYFGSPNVQKNVIQNIQNELLDSCFTKLQEFSKFKEMYDQNLIEVKKLSCPFSTAFIASDPEAFTGKIQCQFYEYGVPTAQCPCVILSRPDEMYDILCDSLLKMWKYATNMS